MKNMRFAVYIALLVSGVMFIVNAIVKAEQLVMWKQCLLIFLGLAELIVAYRLNRKYNLTGRNHR